MAPRWRCRAANLPCAVAWLIWLLLGQTVAAFRNALPVSNRKNVPSISIGTWVQSHLLQQLHPGRKLAYNMWRMVCWRGLHTLRFDNRWVIKTSRPVQDDPHLWNVEIITIFMSGEPRSQRAIGHTQVRLQPGTGADMHRLAALSTPGTRPVYTPFLHECWGPSLANLEQAWNFGTDFDSNDAGVSGAAASPNGPENRTRYQKGQLADFFVLWAGAHGISGK